MKIKLVTFEDGIVSVGFRRISSFVKSQYPDTTSYIYNLSGSGAQFKNIFKVEEVSESIIKDILNEEFINELAIADVVGFSGMSKFAPYIKVAISKVKEINKDVEIIWGGVHATVFAEDAIQHADAVCIGEGELSIKALLEKIEKGEEFIHTKGFWFNESGKVIKNELMPLMNGMQLSSMPFQDYSYEMKYVTHKEIKNMSKDVYVSQQGSKYTTLWVLGCPFKCAYCSNGKFISNDRGYGKIRHATTDYIIEELEMMVKKHDYINYIELEDDMFMLLDVDTIRDFSNKYKERIGLPLFLPGFHPTTVHKDKLELLVAAGLKKVRMGLQSGSARMLKFYNRNTPKKTIFDAAETLASFYPKIIPPFYDIIIDNPIETVSDKEETLSTLMELSRPFMLYIYSLRIIPGTEMCQYAKENPEFNFLPIDYSYQNIQDREMGFMVYLLALYKPSRKAYALFRFMSKKEITNKVGLPIIKILYLFKRLYFELKIKNYQPIVMICPSIGKLLTRKIV